MEKCKVSVIMSTYNTSEQILKEAINSIINQTLQNFEFIIVVDGGNDDIIVKQYTDKRIKILKNKQTMGLPYSLNRAIEICQGEYIARMDSDDIAMKDRLEQEVSFLDKNININICAMLYKRFGEVSGYYINVWNSPDYINARLFYKNIIPHPTVMFRASFIFNNNIRYSLDYRYSQDFELWTRIKKKSNITIIPKIGLKYRIHSKQVSNSKKSEQDKLLSMILLRNLKELEMSDTKLQYLLMLNNKEKNVKFKELSKFIDEVIEQNRKMKIYNEKAIVRVLNMEYFRLMIKSKKYFFHWFSAKRYLHLYVFQYYFIWFIKLLWYKYFKKL